MKRTPPAKATRRKAGQGGRRSGDKKDSSSKKANVRSAGKRRNLRPAQPLSTKEVQASMARTLTDAQQLYSKSDTLHEQADQLHHSIDEAHLTAQRLHKEIRKVMPPAKLEGRAAALGTEQESPAIIGPDLESRKNAKPFPIVGIGASAGGFEALQQLLAAIPAD